MAKFKEAYFWDLKVVIDSEHYADIRLTIGEQVKEFSFAEFAEKLGMEWNWK